MLDALRALPRGAGDAVSEAEQFWRAQVRSRLCDFAARELQPTGRSFYTIASAGPCAYSVNASTSCRPSVGERRRQEQRFGEPERLAVPDQASISSAAMSSIVYRRGRRSRRLSLYEAATPSDAAELHLDRELLVQDRPGARRNLISDRVDRTLLIG
ncbi:MAG: hypothetical protein ACXW0F_12405 [Gaiellaceae bacterium]